MIGFIDTLYTPIRTTINYSAIATSTIYSSLLHTLVVSWQRIHKSLTVTSYHTMKSSLHSPIPFCNFFSITFDSRLSQFYLKLACNPCYIVSGRTHRKHRSFSYPQEYACISQQQIVYEESVSAGTCLRSRCLAMDVYPDLTIPAFGCRVTVSWGL
jgi:hypothetical protein